ncbi:hypothetical protein L7F22_013563 [Adiantum nelumboides]|nr:hypothetical protein [Adiantum nelumboides]
MKLARVQAKQRFLESLLMAQQVQEYPPLSGHIEARFRVPTVSQKGKEHTHAGELSEAPKENLSIHKHVVRMPVLQAISDQPPTLVRSNAGSNGQEIMFQDMHQVFPSSTTHSGFFVGGSMFQSMGGYALENQQYMPGTMFGGYVGHGAQPHGKQTHEVGESSRPPQSDDDIFRTQLVAAVDHIPKPDRVLTQVIHIANSMETPVHLSETMQSPKPMPNAKVRKKAVLYMWKLVQVFDATSNEPWGPHGTLMAEIAQATRNYYELQMVMTILWKRLSDTGRNWRHVYKALTVLEYLVAHGSEKVIDDIIEHVYQITTLADFQFVEANGKDQGINVRQKSQNLVRLVNDKEKIREVRQKAADNRDKYKGVSSTGGMSKPSSYQSGEENYGRYGMQDDYRHSRDGHTNRHRDDDCYGGESDRSSWSSDQYRDHRSKEYDEDINHNRSRNGDDHFNNVDTAHTNIDGQASRKSTEKPVKMTSSSGSLGYKEASSQVRDCKATGDQREIKLFAGQSANSISDESDDFNPRATSGPTSQLEELSNPSGAVKNAPPVPVTASFWGDTSALFGDSVSSIPSNNVQNRGEDLFGHSLSKVEASGSTSSTAVKVGIKPPPSYTPPSNDSKASFLRTSGPMTTSIRPPPSTFAGNEGVTVAGFRSDSFSSSPSGANQAASVGVDFLGLDSCSTSGFISNGTSQPALSLDAPAPPLPILTEFFQMSQPLSTASFNPSQPSVGIASQGQSGNMRPQQAKRFETKSAVWADGLSKGLIDLNISGRKSNSLADIGIDFDQLRTEKVKDDRSSTGMGMPSMGKAMGSGSGLGMAGASAIAPPAMAMGINTMGMGRGMSMGMGTGWGPMMQMGLNPGAAVRPGAGMGPVLGQGGIRKDFGLGGFSNQHQHYGASK